MYLPDIRKGSWMIDAQFSAVLCGKLKQSGIKKLAQHYLWYK